MGWDLNVALIPDHFPNRFNKEFGPTVLQDKRKHFHKNIKNEPIIYANVVQFDTFWFCNNFGGVILVASV